jgi:hypothetical protein
VPPNVRCVPEPLRYQYQEAFRIGVHRDVVKLNHAGRLMSLDVEDLTPDAHEAVASLDDTLGAPSGLLPWGGEAVGYSERYDVGEAVHDAIGKIPSSPIPDWLATFEVVRIGAEIGGIAGLNHMFVRVRGG